MNIEDKTWMIKSSISILAFIAGVVIGFIALFLPPTGIIHNSVLWFIAQMLVMTGTLLGVNIQIEAFKKKYDK